MKKRILYFGLILFVSGMIAMVILNKAASQELNHYWIDEYTERWDVEIGVFHFPVSSASNGSWEVINGRRLTKISGSCWKQKINDIKYIVVQENDCVFEITSHSDYIAFADGSYTGQ